MNDLQQGFLLKKDKKIAKKKEAAAPAKAKSDISSAEEINKREGLDTSDGEPTQAQVNNWIEKERNNLERKKMLIQKHAPPLFQPKLLHEARLEHEVAEMGFLAFQAWYGFLPEKKPLPLSTFIMHYLFGSPRHFTLTYAAWKLVKEDFGLTENEYDIDEAYLIVDALPKLIKPLPFHYQPKP